MWGVGLVAYSFYSPLQVYVLLPTDINRGSTDGVKPMVSFNFFNDYSFFVPLPFILWMTCPDEI